MPEDSDIVQAKLGGHDQAWVEQRTRERAGNAMFENLEFGHGIYPKSHTAFEIVPRLRKNESDMA